jgi:hypothetical protein
MSMVERKGTRHLLRLVAAGGAGLLLMNVAVTASFAGGGNVGVQADYGGGGGGGGKDDDDDGLSTGAAVAIGIGAFILGFALGNTLADDDDDEATTAASALPAASGASEVRLVPQKSTVVSGTSCGFDLQARSEQDGKWYSVTRQPGASISVQDGSSLLVRQGGTKNMFCVPITAAKAGDGSSVTVVGSYTPAGGAPLTAQTAVSVSVPGNTVAAAR